MKKALIISCFDWYKARLAPIRELLSAQGYEVTVLESDFDHIRKEPLAIRYPECTYVHVPTYSSNISISRIRSHLLFGNAVNQYIEKIKPDLIHIQVPPNNTAKYCVKYKRKNPKTQLILDIVDLWPESMPIGNLKNSFIGNKWREWRDDCISVADHVFTECNLYQEQLSGVLDKDKTSTLYLFKDQTEEEKKRIDCVIQKNIIQSEECVQFAYVGSMNSILDIDGICSVIEKYKTAGYHCELHAIGDGENKERFELAVQTIGCTTHFYGMIFDENRKIDILAPCDYALNMMKGNISVGLTIKSIDYLSYGLPLLNNIKGDTWDMVEKFKIGINITPDFHIEEGGMCSRKDIVSLFNEALSRAAFIKKAEAAYGKLPDSTKLIPATQR